MDMPPKFIESVSNGKNFVRDRPKKRDATWVRVTVLQEIRIVGGWRENDLISFF
jgi:hypothetical protein